MRQLLILLAVALATISGASEPGDQPAAHKAYAGPTLPDSQVTTLLLPQKGRILIHNEDSGPSGLRSFRSAVPGEAVKLMPGEYDLSIVFNFHEEEYCDREVVTLEAGHVYAAGAEGWGGGVWTGTVVCLWFEDTATDEILFGYGKPRKRPSWRTSCWTNPRNRFRRLPLVTEYSQLPANRGVQQFWQDECTGGPRADRETLRRREMILDLGEQWLASPIRKSLNLQWTLQLVAEYNEQLSGDHPCPRTPLPYPKMKGQRIAEQLVSPCDHVRFYLQDFVREVEKKAKKGKLTEEVAADLASKARDVLFYVEQTEEINP